MSVREIVTLQFGHYSNFVGTHWWNVQESSFVYDPQLLSTFPKEVNHDVLFREGKTISGHTTFTPRLVLVDLHGSLGSLRREGTLYGASSEENIQWLGDVTLHQTEASEKNKFLQDLYEDQAEETSSDRSCKLKDAETSDTDGPDTGKQDCDDSEESSKSEAELPGPHSYHLDSDVTVWSDFLRTGLHPRSIHLVKEYQHNNSQNDFGIFGQGQQIAKTDREWEALEDQIRYFTEECDQLQGFHILLDNHNGFGGLSSSALSYLSDEFSSKSRLSLGLTPACPPDQTAVERSTRILNSALSLRHCSEHSSLYVPLSLASSLWRNVGAPVKFDNLQYKAELDYHTSAVLAAALDTASLPYRRENDPASISDITSSFSSLGRKVSALNLSLPFPLRMGTTVADTLVSLGQTDPWTSLTPSVHCVSSPMFQSCVLRGVPQLGAKRLVSDSPASRLLSSCSSVDDVLRLYLTETYPGSFNSGCHMRDGVVVSTPFPHIFSPGVNWHGFLSDTERPSHLGVERVPVLTSLQSTSDVFSHIDSLTESVSKFNISKHQHFIEAGLEPDDFTETIHELRSLAQCYAPE
ncbi:protein misato homolog 1 [Aplysia californica]|uniref:Protein misato homolog 1 n=1 Tax=Aplysia californica TaxID=6500 RepID=A0ABM0JWT0_APLCA|nr:protein misato homolog 1 [Aplysia californica]